MTAHVWAAGRSTVRILLVAMSLGIVATRASAQDDPAQQSTREALLESERDQKASNLTPPRPSFVERMLYRYDNQETWSIFGSWHGLHMQGGAFPAGAGPKFGVGFNHVFGNIDTDQPNQLELASLAAYST